MLFSFIELPVERKKNGMRDNNYCLRTVVNGYSGRRENRVFYYFKTISDKDYGVMSARRQMLDI